MKIKVSELKTHLSRYLKHLDDDGPIEVCLREEPVAYLVSALASNPASQQALADKVRSAGLLLHQASRRHAPEILPLPMWLAMVALIFQRSNLSGVKGTINEHLFIHRGGVLGFGMLACFTIRTLQAGELAFDGS